MQGKFASSQFDLGDTDLFCVPEVTSVFFSSCYLNVLLQQSELGWNYLTFNTNVSFSYSQLGALHKPI